MVQGIRRNKKAGQELRERNEALDCRVYARAAAWIAGADRTSEASWAEMERRLRVREKGAMQGGGRTRPAVRRIGKIGSARWTYG